MDDPVAEAAQAVGPAPGGPPEPTGNASTTTTPQEGSAPGTPTLPWRGKYPNPWVDDYSKHPITEIVNKFANTIPPTHWASKCRLGESYAAVVDYYVRTGVDIHPGYLALVSSAVFGGAVVFTKFMDKSSEKNKSDPPAVRRPATYP